MLVLPRSRRIASGVITLSSRKMTIILSISANLRSRTMQIDLRRCAGKFIYPKGGSDLLHFMPLHDFHLESALDISVVVALRASRMSGVDVGGFELSRWMDISSIDAIARTAATILKALYSGRLLRVDEHHTGLG